MISTTITKHIYTANGLNQNWDFSFPIIEPDDIQLWVTEPGGVAELVSNGLYVVTENSGGADGGVVEYPISPLSPLASGYTVTVMRVLPLIQETEFVNQGRIQAESIESGLDRLTMITQQLAETLGRAIVVNVDNTAVTDINSLLLLLASYLSQVQGFVDVVTALLEEAREIRDEIDERMPSGWNRFRVDTDTMELIMSYLGETTTDELWVEDGELMLRLYDDDETIGRIGMVWKGEYSGTITYPFLSIVRYNSSAYLCINENGSTGVAPTNQNNWVLLAQGGAAATIQIGTVESLPAGSSAYITNVGTSTAAVLNVGLVAGQTGATGAKGETGAAGTNGTNGTNGVSPTITVNAVSTLAAGQNAYVTNIGTSQNVILSIGIPRGAQGERGAGINLGAAFDTLADLQTAFPTGTTTAHVVNATGALYIWDGSAWVDAGTVQGAKGDAGEAATITVGTTQTGAAGTNAEVINSGTASAAILNFTVPKGDKGDTGAQGAQGAQGPAGTVTVDPDGGIVDGGSGVAINVAASAAGIKVENNELKVRLLSDVTTVGLDVTTAGDLYARGATLANLGSVYLTNTFPYTAGNLMTAAGAVGVNGINNRLLSMENYNGYAVQHLGTQSSTFTVDASAGNIIECTIAGNLTINLTAATATSGICRVLTFIIKNGGNYTVTWPTSVLWADGEKPTLTSSGTDLVNFMSVDGGGSWYGMLAGSAFA